MKKILIIDDDEDFINAVKILLESEHYKVSSVNNTNGVLDLIKKQTPDLIILDVMMDTLDEGIQFSYKLRSDKKAKNIPILMSTAVAQSAGFKLSPDKDNVDGNWIPVDGFLEKPIKSKEFLQTVKKLLKK